MSVILLLVPRRRDASARGLDAEVSASVSAAAGPFLGPRYEAPPTIAHGMSVDGACLMHWVPTHEQGAFAMSKGRWAVSSSPDTATALLDSVRSRAGGLRYSTPVWGSYMAVLGDRSTDRLVAWNTVPTLEAVHYGVTDDLVVISNRPLLVALGMAGGDRSRLRLSRQYLSEYLNIGYSVSGATPFEGVQTLRPRTSLSVVSGAVGFGPEPAAPVAELESQRDPRRTGAQELAEAFRGAADRALSRRSSDRIQLRLSGGLDSRIILGLVRRRDDVSVTAVTQGSRDSEDVMVASELARTAEVPHVVKHPDFADQRGFIESLERSIIESHGYIPSESLVAPYANASPLEPPEGLMSGQWPLFKGVMDKTTANGLDHVRETIMATNHNILTEEHNLAASEALAQWLATVQASTNIEILYAHARDLRSSRYLQPHTVQADRESHVLYPFTDSQVAAVADVLPIRNRVQNISAFLALVDIWEDATRVPMANGGHFRFEAIEPMDGISGPYFDERRRPLEPYSGPVFRDRPAEERFAEFLADPLVRSARYLVQSPRWPEVRDLLGPDLRTQITELAGTDPGRSTLRYRSRVRRRTLTIHCLRAVLADLWLSRRWLSPADG